MRTFRLVEGVAGLTVLLVAACGNNSGAGGLTGSFGNGGTTGAGASTTTSSGKGGSGGAASSGTTSSTSSTGATTSSTSSTGATTTSSSGTTTSSTSSTSSTTTSSTTSSGAGGSGPTFGVTCDGGTTALTGTVYAPNGTDPIPNVRVYAAIAINPYPANYCDKCSAPIDPAYASTISAADGTYTLPLNTVPAGASIDFAIQIGRFRKHTILPVTACQSIVVPALAETLPGNSTLGDIPKIAVSAGNTDHLDTVLTALGITQYDCYEGRAVAGSSTTTCAQIANTNIGTVIATAATLDTYNMAFLSCAPDAYNTYITPVGTKTAAGHPGLGYDQATMTANTQAWVANGGRLFVTDTAYDYVAQAFPPDITWEGTAGSPQPIDTANIGCAPAGAGGVSAHAVKYTITVDDPTLSAWLQVVGYPAPVNVDGFYEPWSTMASLATTSTLIANGTMPLDPTYTTTMCKTPTMTNVPLTAEFDVPTCGRVLFSSYHTYTGATTDAGAGGPSANEKIMEYMIFAAAYCHG